MGSIWRTTSVVLPSHPWEKLARRNNAMPLRCVTRDQGRRIRKRSRPAELRWVPSDCGRQIISQAIQDDSHEPAYLASRR